MRVQVPVPSSRRWTMHGRRSGLPTCIIALFAVLLLLFGLIRGTLPWPHDSISVVTPKRRANTSVHLTELDKMDLLPQLYLSIKHKWGFCVPPKNSCTSFKVALAKIEGLKYNTTRQLHDKRNFPFTTGMSLPMDTVEHILNDPEWTFVTVTRDPYERVLSGYLNKFVGDTEGLKKAGCSAYYHRSTSWFTRFLPCPPSFKQFVSVLYRTATSLQNEHFMPQSLICQYSRIPYKYVLEMAELEEEMPKILSSVGIRDVHSVWPQKNIGGHESGASKMLCAQYRDETVLASVERLYALDLDQDWAARYKRPVC